MAAFSAQPPAAQGRDKQPNCCNFNHTSSDPEQSALPHRLGLPVECAQQPLALLQVAVLHTRDGGQVGHVVVCMMMRSSSLRRPARSNNLLQALQQCRMAIERCTKPAVAQRLPLPRALLPPAHLAVILVPRLAQLRMACLHGRQRGAGVLQLLRQHLESDESQGGQERAAGVGSKRQHAWSVGRARRQAHNPVSHMSILHTPPCSGTLRHP